MKWEHVPKFLIVLAYQILVMYSSNFENMWSFNMFDLVFDVQAYNDPSSWY